MKQSESSVGTEVQSKAKTVLNVQNVSTRFFTNEGQVNAVEKVSFDVKEGEIFGIVGESGSGKSVTAYTILDLVESPGRVTEGEIWYREPELASSLEAVTSEAVDGDFVNLVDLPTNVRRRLRGSSISMIFQDPMSSFDPSYTVGEQIAEAVEVQRRAQAEPRSLRSQTPEYGLASLVASKVFPSQRYVSEASYRKATDLLQQVGIPDAEERIKEYPHQFSGGMLQRAMIAMALAGEPDLLIADEPTTALDVTIQAQILNLLMDIQEERGMSIILITHDLGIVSEMCDRVGVMYAGEIVERGTMTDIFDGTAHPYTKGLLDSIPDIDGTNERLTGIEGNVPSLLDSELGNSCYFSNRCPHVMDRCVSSDPPERPVDGKENHSAKCVLVDDESQPITEDDS